MLFTSGAFVGVVTGVAPAALGDAGTGAALFLSMNAVIRAFMPALLQAANAVDPFCSVAGTIAHTNVRKPRH